MASILEVYGKVYVDNAGGTLTEVSDLTTRAVLNIQNGIVDDSRLNTRYTQNADGRISWSVDMEITVELGSNAYSSLTDWMFSGGARTFRIDTPDSAAGSVRYEGETRLASLGNVVALAQGGSNVQKTSVSLTGTGTLTKSTIV